MNKAYETYLRNALEHYGHTDDHEAIGRFIDFLNHYRPDGDSTSEPDVYDYGDAAGTYAYGYIDEQSLNEYEAIGETVANDHKPALLRAWAETIHDRLGDEDCDILPETFHRTMEAFRDK